MASSPFLSLLFLRLILLLQFFDRLGIRLLSPLILAFSTLHPAIYTLCVHLRVALARARSQASGTHTFTSSSLSLSNVLLFSCFLLQCFLVNVFQKSDACNCELPVLLQTWFKPLYLRCDLSACHRNFRSCVALIFLFSASVQS